MWQVIILAGECLLEMSFGRAKHRTLGAELVKRVRHRFTYLIGRSFLEPKVRTRAGSVLSALGDERDLTEMVSVPAGEFIMGSTDEQVEEATAMALEAYKSFIDNGTLTEEQIRNLHVNETPQHLIHLDAFRISKYPVTNEEYARFIAATEDVEPPQHWRGSRPPPEIRNHSVVYVRWHDAQAYCRWLSQEQGTEIRLPTEAEWEMAARGVDGRIYPWGDKFDAQKCNMFDTGIGSTSSVGLFPKGISPYGCLDMSGNVWEWCSTQWLENYENYEEKTAEDAKEDAGRVVRGGSFDSYFNLVRSAARGWGYPDVRDFNLGFRILSPGL